MDGWVKFHRKAYDNFLYRENRPHTRREAWEDIIALANHEDSVCLLGNEKIEVKRGQSIRSLETWAKLFNWDKSKVKRFFDLLRNEKMIVTEDLRKTTRITICNYEYYQGDRNTDETQVKRKRNATETPATPNKNDKNDKEEIEVRRQKFVDCLSQFKDRYDADMLNAFYRYWSEKNQKGTKMRFEMQDTWEVSKRLATWESRNQKVKV